MARRTVSTTPSSRRQRALRRRHCRRRCCFCCGTRSARSLRPPRPRSGSRCHAWCSCCSSCWRSPPLSCWWGWLWTSTSAGDSAVSPCRGAHCERMRCPWWCSPRAAPCSGWRGAIACRASREAPGTRTASATWPPSWASGCRDSTRTEVVPPRSPSSCSRWRRRRKPPGSRSKPRWLCSPSRWSTWQRWAGCAARVRPPGLRPSMRCSPARPTSP
jgi:hypothetical protein